MKWLLGWILPNDMWETFRLDYRVYITANGGYVNHVFYHVNKLCDDWYCKEWYD